MKPIDLNFKPSFILSATILLVAAMASWIICLFSLPLSLQSLCLLLIWLAAIDKIIGDALRLYPWSPAKCYVNARNELNVTRKDGRVLNCVAIQHDSVVTPILTIIHFQTKQALWYQRLFSHRVIILQDSLDADDFRQLRVWLLWGQKHK